MTSNPHVVFVCLHGAAKSVLAAADFERMAKERGLRVAAEWAGTEPDPEIAPPVLAALKAEGVDMAGRRPRLVTREMAAGATRVVAFGCGLGAAAPDGDRIEAVGGRAGCERRAAGRAGGHPAAPRAPARRMERVMKWITRTKARVDRIACPWLIRRFIDTQAEFLFVPDALVTETAAREGATPYDVPGVELGHHGERCSFDAFLDKYGLTDPALQALALIVRGADTDARGIAKEAWGLYAVASGFREISRDDFENMERQFPVYDALYAYCRSGLTRGA